MLLYRKTEATLILSILQAHLQLHPPHNIQRKGLLTVQVALRQVAVMIDRPFHYTRPPPIPVVFNRIQNLLAVAVEELRRNKLLRVNMYSDEPMLLGQPVV